MFGASSRLPEAMRGTIGARRRGTGWFEPNAGFFLTPDAQKPPGFPRGLLCLDGQGLGGNTLETTQEWFESPGGSSLVPLDQVGSFDQSPQCSKSLPPDR